MTCEKRFVTAVFDVGGAGGYKPGHYLEDENCINCADTKNHHPIFMTFKPLGQPLLFEPKQSFSLFSDLLFCKRAAGY